MAVKVADNRIYSHPFGLQGFLISCGRSLHHLQCPEHGGGGERTFSYRDIRRGRSNKLHILKLLLWVFVFVLLMYCFKPLIINELKYFYDKGKCKTVVFWLSVYTRRSVKVLKTPPSLSLYRWENATV